MFVYRLFLLEKGLYFPVQTLLRPNLDYQPEGFKGGERHITSTCFQGRSLPDL